MNKCPLCDGAKGEVLFENERWHVTAEAGGPLFVLKDHRAKLTREERLEAGAIRVGLIGRGTIPDGCWRVDRKNFPDHWNATLKPRT